MIPKQKTIRDILVRESNGVPSTKHAEDANAADQSKSKGSLKVDPLDTQWPLLALDAIPDSLRIEVSQQRPQKALKGRKCQALEQLIVTRDRNYQAFIQGIQSSLAESDKFIGDMRSSQQRWQRHWTNNVAAIVALSAPSG
jgi:hypothetical protein